MEPSQMKPKKIMSEVALQNLAKARQAAALKKKEMGELTKLRKQAADQLIADEKKKLENILNEKTPVPIVAHETPVVAPVVPAPKQAPKVKKVRPQIVIEESSDEEDSDEPIVYIRKPKPKVLVEEPFHEPPPPVPVKNIAPPPPVYQPRFFMPLSNRRY